MRHADRQAAGVYGRVVGGMKLIVIIHEKNFNRVTGLLTGNGGDAGGQPFLMIAHRDNDGDLTR